MATTIAVWHVLGASVPGSGHLAMQRGCDDVHAFRQHADGTVLLAVADGAGSASRAAEGAACAVESVMEALEQALGAEPPPPTNDAWERLLRRSLASSHDALVAIATADGAGQEQGVIAALPELATTLLLAVVTPDRLAAAQIRDGVIVVQDDQEGVQALTWPEHGEYINQTVFLTETDYGEHVQCQVVEVAAIQGIALLSDGLELLALDGRARQPHVPFFGPLFAFARQETATAAALEAFLGSPRVCTRTDDDKTLLLAVR